MCIDRETLEHVLESISLTCLKLATTWSWIPLRYFFPTLAPQLEPLCYTVLQFKYGIFKIAYIYSYQQNQGILRI